MQFPVLIHIGSVCCTSRGIFSLVGMNKNQSSLKERNLKILIGHIMYGQNFAKQVIKSVGLPPDFF